MKQLVTLIQGYYPPLWPVTPLTPPIYFSLTLAYLLSFAIVSAKFEKLLKHTTLFLSNYLNSIPKHCTLKCNDNTLISIPPDSLYLAASDDVHFIRF